MAGKKREKVREEDITGLKYFDKLQPLLRRLHDVGSDRDKAGNRKLHINEYCLLILLMLFNPIVRSLRAIQQASELRKVQRKLGCLRASLGSLSEATDVFYPARLQEVIVELGAELRPIASDSRLKELRHVVTLVDGTLLKGLPVLARAALQDARAAQAKAKWRLHTQFNLARGVSVRIDLTEGNAGGGGRTVGPSDKAPIPRRLIKRAAAFPAAAKFVAARMARFTRTIIRKRLAASSRPVIIRSHLATSPTTCKNSAEQDLVLTPFLFTPFSSVPVSQFVQVDFFAPLWHIGGMMSAMVRQR